MAYTDFACPKFALSWIFILIKSLFISLALVILFDDTFMKTAGVFFGILEYYTCCQLTEYGFSLNKIFIPTKISTHGISNLFCKIKWNEVEQVCFEHLKTKTTPRNHYRLKYVNDDFGLIMLIHKKKENADKSFKKCPLRQTICVSLNVKTKSAILRNCPEGLLMRDVARTANEITILERISKCETELCIPRRKKQATIVNFNDMKTKTD